MSTPVTTCCGTKPPGVAGAPLVDACQLCPHSPTYWRGPDHREPAPAPAAGASPAEQPALEMPVAPNLPAVRPHECGAGVTPCGAPARLYPCGWRCGEHAPSAGGAA